MALYTIVIPAKAGIQVEEGSSKRTINKVLTPSGDFYYWIPAFAGMTMGVGTGLTYGVFESCT
jgi:hypothetical protein